MKPKEYGRNQKKRKEYIHQSGLLIAGVDVSKAKYDACIGTLEGVMGRSCRVCITNASSARTSPIITILRIPGRP